MTTDSTFRYEINNALDEAPTQVMNGQALNLPRVPWSLCFVEGCGAGVIGTVAGRDCIEQVGLEYTGHAHGQPEWVWAITDHDAFEGDCQLTSERADAPRAAR